MNTHIQDKKSKLQSLNELGRDKFQKTRSNGDVIDSSTHKSGAKHADDSSNAHKKRADESAHDSDDITYTNTDSHQVSNHITERNDYLEDISIDVDRVCFTCPFPSKFAEKFDNKMSKIMRKVVQAEPSSKSDTNYHKTCIYTTKAGTRLYISWEPKKKGLNFARFEICSSMLTSDCINEFQSFLRRIYGSYYSNVFMSKRSRVTKVELSFELTGIQTEEVIIELNNTRTYEYHISSNGYSSYKQIGSKKSTHVKVYEERTNVVKSHSLINNGHLTNIIPVTKVNIVINPKTNTVPIKDLGNIDFKVGNFFILKSSIITSIPKAYIYMINSVGVFNAIYSLSDREREHFYSALESHTFDIFEEHLNEKIKDSLLDIERIFSI